MIKIEFYVYDPTTGNRSLLKTELYESKSVAEEAADKFCKHQPLSITLITEVRK